MRRAPAPWWTAPGRDAKRPPPGGMPSGRREGRRCLLYPQTPLHQPCHPPCFSSHPSRAALPRGWSWCASVAGRTSLAGPPIQTRAGTGWGGGCGEGRGRWCAIPIYAHGVGVTTLSAALVPAMASSSQGAAWKKVSISGSSTCSRNSGTPHTSGGLLGKLTPCTFE